MNAHGYSTQSDNYTPPQPPKRPRKRAGRGRRRGRGYDIPDPTLEAVIRSLAGPKIQFFAELADGSRVTFLPAQVLALARATNRQVCDMTRDEIQNLLRGVA